MNVFMGNVVVSFKGIKLKRYLITEPNPPPTPTMNYHRDMMLIIIINQSEIT